MTQKEYLEKFRFIIDDLYTLTSNKNSDYANLKDAFANFRQISQLTSDRVSVTDGILVRMTDKLSRIASLLTPGKEAKVKDESIKDTVRDLAVYSIILYIWLESQQEVKK